MPIVADRPQSAAFLVCGIIANFFASFLHGYFRTSHDWQVLVVALS